MLGYQVISLFTQALQKKRYVLAVDYRGNHRVITDAKEYQDKNLSDEYVLIKLYGYSHDWVLYGGEWFTIDGATLTCEALAKKMGWIKYKRWILER